MSAWIELRATLPRRVSTPLVAIAAAARASDGDDAPLSQAARRLPSCNDKQSGAVQIERRNTNQHDRPSLKEAALAAELHDASIVVRGCPLMTRLFFHCKSPDDLLLDLCGSEIQDLAEAKDRALAVARMLMSSAYGIDDFAGWFICVGDEQDEEVMRVPFALALPTLH